jgi:hypothetical protein
MSGIGKRLLTSAFRVAMWAGMGAGIMATFDSPPREKHLYPSLSQSDAAKSYHNNIGLVAAIYGVMEAETLIGRAKGRREERADQKASLTPT